MKVLVTGGAGFIGSHTVEELIEKGHEVIVVDFLQQEHFAYFHPEAIFYEADITDETKINDIFARHQPEAVIHLAAQVDVQTSLIHPALDVHTNVKGTIMLLENCRKYKAKMVFASSAAVYGTPDALPITENNPLQPLSVYGLSKLSAEKYIELYHTLYGVSFAILRYANVYGPRQDASGEGGVVSIFIDRLVNEESVVIYGNGEQTRDFVYVKDVAKANVKAAEAEVNQIFNVSSNAEISINELLNKISKQAGQITKPRHEKQRTGDITRSVIDSSNIYHVLGWKSEHTLENGLNDTIQFTKNQFVPAEILR